MLLKFDRTQKLLLYRDWHLSLSSLSHSSACPASDITLSWLGSVGVRLGRLAASSCRTMVRVRRVKP